MTPGGLHEAEQIQRTPDHRDLKAVEAGRTVKDVCREHEISEATYYRGSQSTAACKLQTSSAYVNWKKKTDD